MGEQGSWQGRFSGWRRAAPRAAHALERAAILPRPIRRRLGWHHLPLTEAVAPESRMAAAYKARNEPGAAALSRMSAGLARMSAGLGRVSAAGPARVSAGPGLARVSAAAPAHTSMAAGPARVIVSAV